MSKVTVRRPKKKAKDGSWSEVRDGMRIDWDLPITMEDGTVLRADVFRPTKADKYPVIMTMGPYGKGLAWQDDLYATTWELFTGDHPDAIKGSTNKYQNWETVDPEQWVPDGYACVRIDSRGAGRSQGYMDCWSPRESEDYVECIEWAGTQNWSNGKVGLNGISYYGMNQWWVAERQPKYLAAMCAWEAANDYYREFARHGGILCTFIKNWYDMQVQPVQYGAGTKGYQSWVHGDPVAGPPTLSAADLKRNRADMDRDILRREMEDDWYRARRPDFKKIKVPLLSPASWGGQGLHPRGNYEGFYQAGSKEKWLECHGLEHWTEFYTAYGVALQKQFFAHYLKGEKNGWEKKPPVLLKVRHVGEKFVERTENEWPIKRTKWKKQYLDTAHMTLEPKAPATRGKITYAGMGDGVTFFLPPMDEGTEITGPLASKLFVSSATADADLFLVVRLFSPDMKEVTFKGTVDPHTPIAQGWLRASHRKLDAKMSKPWRPWHSHDEKQPLKPGQVYELDIEIWPTCIVVPAGYRLALSVRGKDYEYSGGALELSNFAHPLKGCGPFLHDDPRDRPKKIFGGDVTLYAGPNHQSYVMLPVIPTKKKALKKKAPQKK
jgi:predicted acyl esterase